MNTQQDISQAKQCQYDSRQISVCLFRKSKKYERQKSDQIHTDHRSDIPVRISDCLRCQECLDYFGRAVGITERKLYYKEHTYRDCEMDPKFERFYRKLSDIVFTFIFDSFHYTVSRVKQKHCNNSLFNISVIPIGKRIKLSRQFMIADKMCKENKHYKDSFNGERRFRR